MRLIIVHYHLRPGGIRRVIELAIPPLLHRMKGALHSVVLATGEASDNTWNDSLRKSVGLVPLEFFTEPALGYLSEQRGSVKALRRRVHNAVRRLLKGAHGGNSVVWAHNLGIARNLILTRELVQACDRCGVTLVAHHHDWWFDNRWLRWPEMRRNGTRTLAAVARTVFPVSPTIRHVTISQADYRVLKRHLGGRVAWIPNPTERMAPPQPASVGAAQRWLGERIGNPRAPVWILPCRLLRRKNIAEALLLTRWLRPEAWLVTTGGVSSADEMDYGCRLEAAARKNQWMLRLGLLAEHEATNPSVPELLAASECVILTSIQEGFGLPYLEAAAAGRPLVARALPNIAPDLAKFGFQFPQSYGEVLIDRRLFDWQAEVMRQKRLYNSWKQELPSTCRKLAGEPAFLSSVRAPVPFSRLSLTAQLEVLSQPVKDSWAICAPLNPALVTWRRRAATGTMRSSPWPGSADDWLSGGTYAQRLADVFGNAVGGDGRDTAVELQRELIQWKLSAANLYPLLWAKDT